MKKCPYCAEEIQDDAIKCRYCQSDLVKRKDQKDGAAPTTNEQGNVVQKKGVDVVKNEPEKIRKHLKIAGILVVALGVILALYFVYNVLIDPLWMAVMVFSAITKNIVVAVLFPVYIIVGKKIAAGTDKKIPSYVRALFILFIIVAVFSLISRSYVALVIHAALAIYYFKLNSAVGQKGFVDTLKEQEKTLSKKDLRHYSMIYFLVVVALVLAMYIRADRYLDSAPEAVEQKKEQKMDKKTKKDDTNENLQELVAEVNKSVPQKIDDITTFTKMTTEDHAVVYNYSISDKDLRANDESEEQIRNFKQRTLIDEFCNDPNMQILLGMDVTIHSDYFDYKKDHIARVSVRPSDCD